LELPPPPITDISEQLKAEDAPAPNVPIIVISDAEPPPTLPEAPAPSIIPVISKKDDTMEIAVNHKEESKDTSLPPPPPPADPEAPGTFKIPVKGE
jgi:hypothetical protein